MLKKISETTLPIVEIIKVREEVPVVMVANFGTVLVRHTGRVVVQAICKGL